MIPAAAVLREQIESRPGTYALLLQAPRAGWAEIGRLGEMRLRRGFYIYVGSAFGPGGLRARILHHLSPVPRPHWHLDYLRQWTRAVGVWYCYGPPRREHQWARQIALEPGAMVPVPGFGASDCRCASHLYFFAQRPSLRLPAVRLCRLLRPSAG